MNKVPKILLSSTVVILLLCLFSVIAAAELQRGTVKVSSLALRSGPGTNYKILGMLPKGQVLDILSTSGNWARVKTSTGNTAWVYNSYITKAAPSSTVQVKNVQVSKSGTITASSLNLRSGPGTAHSSTGLITKGQAVTVLSVSGDWSRIKTIEGRTGWVYNKYIGPAAAVSAKPVSANSTANSVQVIGTSRSGDDISTASKIVEFSERFLGVPYVWGGATPNGFDCSGLVYYVFKNYGYTLKRVAADQATQGTAIGKDDLKPGDLVFFDTDGGHSNISHVGIYIGGGKMIHAPSPGKNVRITDITTGFYANNYMAARRIIK